MIRDKRRISLCITSYNRVEETIRSFRDVLNDERIGEIVIVDDHSNLELFERLNDKVEELNNQVLITTIDNGKEIPRIRLSRNEKNLGVYLNKYRSVELAEYPYCIIFDSDNIIGKDYVDKLFQYAIWDSNCIYAPDYAMPVFDYQQFAGKIVDKFNVKDFTKLKMFDCWINTMNYFVNKKAFLSVKQGEVLPDAADSMYINYLLLRKGISIFTVSNMRYIHTVHDESNYVKKEKGDRKLLEGTLKKFRDGVV